RTLKLLTAALSAAIESMPTVYEHAFVMSSTIYKPNSTPPPQHPPKPPSQSVPLLSTRGPSPPNRRPERPRPDPRLLNNGAGLSRPDPRQKPRSRPRRP